MKRVLALSLLLTSAMVSAMDVPTEGTNKSAVESQYGSPSAKTPAVGEPPISSWEYADFTVYFEHDHVIHAVKKNEKKQAK